MKETRIQDLVRRVRGEFLEMPGLRLTLQQARRLWRLDEFMCDAVLAVLVDAHFLAQNLRRLVRPSGRPLRLKGTV